MEEASQSRPVRRINDIGFSVLHDPKDAITDLVFIHGLGGHPRKTWTSEEKSEDLNETTGASQRGFKKLFSRKHKIQSTKVQKPESNEVFWPLDLLSEDCVDSRILTWGYDSKISHFFGGPTNQSSIAAHTKNLLRGLNRYRLDCPERSLIFIAHSLGGIVVKDLLYEAYSNTDPALLKIFTSTEAILFLGTPHRGITKAGIGEVIRKIVSVSGFDATDQNIKALRVNSTELERIHELFMKLYDKQDRKFQVLTFQEAKGVVGISYLKLNERVVEPFSSSITTTEPTQTINANHMSMCRYPSRDDEGYKQVSGEIQILVHKIRKRKDKEVLEKGTEIVKSKNGSPSQMTTASATYSFTDVERKCVALLVQNTLSAADYRSTLPSRVEGTCQWVLSDSQYLDWNMRNETCLLWISGYPGSGKTTLSAYILEYLDAGEYSPSLRTTICYFFCDEKIDKQRDGTAILRSLIHQLLMRRRLLIKYIKSAYDVHGPNFEQNFNELWRIFMAIASDKRVGPVRVIVDAIDECEQTTRERFLQNVVRLTGKPRSGGNAPCIKFLVTSRPLLGRQYTTNLLQLDPSLNNIEQDLRLVIKTKVEGIVRRTRCKSDVKIYLENALYSKSDRTFLWVTLVLHLLEKSFVASQRDFKRIIDELPDDLTTTYDCYLHGISTKYQEHATKLLHLIVGSLRPLTLEEIRILMAIQDHHRTLADVEEDAQPNIQESIEGILGPLVRIWDSRIYLVHQSLKEFLQTLSAQKDHPLSAIYGVESQRASLLLAEACVSYLLLDDFKQDLFSWDKESTIGSPTSPVASSIETGSMNHWTQLDLAEDTMFKDPTASDDEACIIIAAENTLFEYSAKHWPEHFSSACSISSPELQESVLLLLDTSNSSGWNWFRFYWLHAEIGLSYPQEFVPIIAASYFGHTTSLISLLHNDHSIKPDVGGHAIYWASRMGHYDVVDLLLQAKFDPDGKELNGQNSFIAAVQFNRLQVVKRLLEDEGFISESKGYRVNYAVTGGRTPLSIAAGGGYTEIVRELLKHNHIQPDIADFDKWTPPFWSISGKHLELLMLLLTDDRISVNHVDKSGRNVLSWAASEGETEIVRYLISLKQLTADESDRNGRTALSWAAGNGHLETTSYLCRTKRIDVSIKDNDGRNALSWACSGCHDKVIECLIEHNRQGVDEPDIDGWTPLAWALFTRAPTTVQLLIDSGLVNVNKKDKMGRSPLSWAAAYGYLDVVEILLKTNGIDVNSKDRYGQTALSSATRFPDVVKALQESSR